MYADSKIRFATLEGNTSTDKALTIWQGMTPEQRVEIMGQVGNFKSTASKYRACINYIADHIA